MLHWLYSTVLYIVHNLPIIFYYFFPVSSRG